MDVHTVSQKKLTDNCSTLLSMSLQYTDNVVAFGWLHLITRSASMYLQFFFFVATNNQAYASVTTRGVQGEIQWELDTRTHGKRAPRFSLQTVGRPRILKMGSYGDFFS